MINKIMETERQPCQDLIKEALEGRPRFQVLSEKQKGEIQVGVGAVIQQLRESCGSRWNSVGFRGLRIIVSGKDCGGAELATSIKARVKEFGIPYNTVYPMVAASIKNVVMMIQAGVNTLAELKKFKHRSKTGSSGGIRGREFHTNPVGPYNQRRTTLL